MEFPYVHLYFRSVLFIYYAVGLFVFNIRFFLCSLDITFTFHK